MKAHNEAVSSIAFSLYIPGLLATCSTDTSVKVFDLLTPHTDVASKCGPRLVTSKKMNVGPLYSISLFPGKPFLLSAAGQEGAVAIWDGAEDTFISRCFTSNRRLSAPPQYKRPQPNPQTIQGSSQQQVTQSHADIDNQEVASSFGNALGALEATSAASKNTKKNGKKGKKKKKKKR
jgi:WD40 repeat protein